MNFETSIAKKRTIQIDGKDYTVNPLTVTDLSEAADMIYKKELEVKPTATKMTLYETGINLIFHNPHLALYAALYKNHPDIEFATVNSLNLLGSEDTTELLGYLVGIELQKKTS